ncbi:cephalosporin C acetylhydrolase, partial [Sodiomyces alkalinus F11]
MHYSTLLALLPAMAMASPLAAQTKRDVPAPLLKPRGADILADKYIVKMKDGLRSSSIQSTISTYAAKADHVYKLSHLRGFAGTLTAEELQTLRDDPNVEYIEHDAVIRKFDVQENAPWGLARLSSSAAGATSYAYDSSAGAGTCAYVVDTGIDVNHPDFNGRATWGGNFVDTDNTDGDGHGTHVAGTIGGTTFGVAKQTSLYAVKVLDANGFGTIAGVMAGMEFTVTDSPSRSCPSGVVVNMSLGGGYSATLNAAAAAVVNAGLFLAVAAGNEAQDAGNVSPASEVSACTVGATTSFDSLASFSNFGSVVDILAPGDNVESALPGGSSGSFSGTSMASPHVAGLAAYFLALGGAPSDPVGLCSYIGESAISGAISGVPISTVNLLTNN